LRASRQLGLTLLLGIVLLLAGCRGGTAPVIVLPAPTDTLGPSPAAPLTEATAVGRIDAKPTAAPGATSAQVAHSLFLEPDDGARPVLDAIRSARATLDVKVYLLSDRETIAAIKDAQARGVKVRVMLEKDPYGTGPGNQAAFDELTLAGAAVKWSSPAFQLTHEKSMVVDGRSALIMTLNLVRSAFTRNREYGIVTRDPAEVREVLDGFNADWTRTKLTPPAHSTLLWSPANSRQRLLAFIDGARQSLVLEQEEMQDTEIQRHVAEAAERGVAVRALVAAPFAGSDGTDHNLRGERQLKSAGAAVRTLDQPTLHAKMWLADGGRAIVGSVNVSKSSLDDNRELAIEISDPAIIRRIAQTFEEDWAAGAVLR